jgi:hypothetical protein
VGVAVNVGEAVNVGVAVGVPVCVGLGVDVAVGVAVEVAVGVGVGGIPYTRLRYVSFGDKSGSVLCNTARHRRSMPESVPLNITPVPGVAGSQVLPPFALR